MSPRGGIATSAGHGRSLSLGIADAVTVLARTASRADAAATIIANAVDLPGHPGYRAVARRRIRSLTATSASRLVTRGVGELSRLRDRGSARIRCGVCAAGCSRAGLDRRRHIALAWRDVCGGAESGRAGWIVRNRPREHDGRVDACRRRVRERGKIRCPPSSARSSVVDETCLEMGQAVTPPTRRARAIAVIDNPFAGRYVENLDDADRHRRRARRAAGASARSRRSASTPARPQSYGKAAIVGEAGELEHAAAILHPEAGRAAAQGGREGCGAGAVGEEARRPRHRRRRAARPQGRRLRAQPLRRDGGARSPTRRVPTRSWSRWSSPTAAGRCRASAACRSRDQGRGRAALTRTFPVSLPVRDRSFDELIRCFAPSPRACAHSASCAPAQGMIKIGEINSYTAQPAFLEPYRKGWSWRSRRSTPRAASSARRSRSISRDDDGKPGDAVRVADELVSTREGRPADRHLPVQHRPRGHRLREAEEGSSSWPPSR